MQLINSKKKTNSAHDMGEYENFRILRAASLGIVGIIFVGVSIVLYFMYINIFNTIAQVHSIILLSNEYGSDVIDFPLYEQVKKGWDEKSGTARLAPLPRNIFSGSVSPTSNAPSPSVPTGAPQAPSSGVNRSL